MSGWELLALFVIGVLLVPGTLMLAGAAYGFYAYWADRREMRQQQGDWKR